MRISRFFAMVGAVAMMTGMAHAADPPSESTFMKRGSAAMHVLIGAETAELKQPGVPTDVVGSPPGILIEDLVAKLKQPDHGVLTGSETAMTWPILKQLAAGYPEGWGSPGDTKMMQTATNRHDPPDQSTLYIVKVITTAPAVNNAGNDYLTAAVDQDEGPPDIAHDADMIVAAIGPGKKKTINEIAGAEATV